MSNDSNSKSASEYDSESDSDEDNDDEVLAVIDDSSDQDSAVESDEADDAREAVVHSKFRKKSWVLDGLFSRQLCNVKCRLTTMAPKIYRVYLVYMLNLI